MPRGLVGKVSDQLIMFFILFLHMEPKLIEITLFICLFIFYLSFYLEPKSQKLYKRNWVLANLEQLHC